MSTKTPLWFPGVALVSLATLVLELTLTRLFSATMFYREYRTRIESLAYHLGPRDKALIIGPGGGVDGYRRWARLRREGAPR